MDRKQFLMNLGLLPLAVGVMKSVELAKLNNGLESTDKMPILFLGHGSPMNAIEENSFVRGFRAIGKDIEKPKAILCISAHWETRGTYVTAMQNPRTIHDFGGFPQALFDVQYPAPGSPELAATTKELITSTQVGLDHQWGLDHGAWSVIKHLYPNADIPVIQMSLDYGKSPEYHYQLAKELGALRQKGVLIIGSGNLVHNLGMIAWDKMNLDNYGYDWAIEANQQMKQYIADRDHQKLIRYGSHGTAWKLAIPSPDHYLPLLYIIALQDDKEQAQFYNDQTVAGAISMTSVRFG